MTRGPDGMVREVTAYGEEGVGVGELGQLGQIRGED
jgi:hypothetical protein